MAFLTKSFKEPMKKLKKLLRVLAYLKGTPEECFTLSTEDTKLIKWWVESLDAMHKYMRIHTGVMMSMVKRILYYMSKKQKLNTYISTETELVAEDNVMPKILWTRYFLESQGYRVGASKIYQDNMSAMFLKKNRKSLNGDRTRHIRIREFFLKDRVDTEEAIVDHYPTDEMLDVLITKPLQGSKFRRIMLLI